MKKLSEKKSGIIIAGVAVLIVLAALAISLLVYALLRPTRGPSRPDSVWPLPPNDDLQSTVTVSTFSGNVRGRRTTTVSLGKTYFSFKGMQYAVAPLRELRFRPPRRLERWNTSNGQAAIDAFEFGNVCVQRNSVGNEDCLFINVYTPSPHSNENYPVVVVIHDGMFHEGSGNDYAPDFLLNQDDVVVVTFNYRLGPFGFLSLNTREHSGNMGLKDQLLALRWIQDNVPFFGGDLNQITLLGFGAGSVSAHMHVLSIQSRRIFQRAILVGGAAVNPWAISYESQVPRLMQFAAENGQPNLTSDNLIDYLETVDAYLLASQTTQPILLSGTGPTKVSLFYTPRVEPVGAIESFISESPMTTIYNGYFDPNISIMFSVAFGEAYPFITDVLNNPSLLIPFNDQLEIQFPVYPLNQNLDFNSERYKVVAQRIRKFYFDESAINHTTIPQFSRLMSDMLISYGVDWSARQHARQANDNGRLARMFYYRLSAVTDFNLARSRTLAQFWDLYGATHGDEHFYTFGATDELKEFYANVPMESVEWRMVNAISKMYTNFIRFGNPMVDARPVFFAPLSDWNFMDVQNDVMQPSRLPHAGSPVFWDETIEEFLYTSTETELPSEEQEISMENEIHTK